MRIIKNDKINVILENPSNSGSSARIKRYDLCDTLYNCYCDEYRFVITHVTVLNHSTRLLRNKNELVLFTAIYCKTCTTK
jgi:hypothetical protein